MTNEEAILMLKKIWGDLMESIARGMGGNKDVAEAINMAIKALEKAEEQRWIPCGERLPKKDETVLVTVNGSYRCIRFDNDSENDSEIVNGSYHCISFDNAIEMGGYDCEGWYIFGFEKWKNPNVTAWMPLPDHYKAKERMKPNKNGIIYYCAKCGCDVGSYGLASGKIHKDTKCRKCGTIVDWEAKEG